MHQFLLFFLSLSLLGKVLNITEKMEMDDICKHHSEFFLPPTRAMIYFARSFEALEAVEGCTVQNLLKIQK